MKQKIVTAVILGGMVAAIIALFVGLFYFISWDNANDKKEATIACAKNAETFGLEEYYSDGYDCYVVKDGKIIKVE